MLSDTIYHRVLQKLPQSVSFAFAYGSGVFRQLGENQKAMETPTRPPGQSRCEQAVATLTKPFKSPLNIVRKSEVTLEERLEKLRKREAELDSEIAALESEGYTVEDKKAYIEALHEYNEMKDVTQVVLGRLAVAENVTVKELHEEYGLETKE